MTRQIYLYKTLITKFGKLQITKITRETGFLSTESKFFSGFKSFGGPSTEFVLNSFLITKSELLFFFTLLHIGIYH